VAMRVAGGIVVGDDAVDKGQCAAIGDAATRAEIAPDLARLVGRHDAVRKRQGRGILHAATLAATLLKGLAVQERYTGNRYNRTAVAAEIRKGRVADATRDSQDACAETHRVDRVVAAIDRHAIGD